MHAGAKPYLNPGPERSEIDSRKGDVLLEFGTEWCGHCQAALPLVEDALAKAAPVEHIKVEDGSGRPLGRSFRVKLWPTLIAIKDGVEAGRVVRPQTSDEISAILPKIS